MPRYPSWWLRGFTTGAAVPVSPLCTPTPAIFSNGNWSKAQLLNAALCIAPMLKTTFHASANIPRPPSTSPHFLHSQSIVADGLLARCVRTESTTPPTQPLPMSNAHPFPCSAGVPQKRPAHRHPSNHTTTSYQPAAIQHTHMHVHAAVSSHFSPITHLLLNSNHATATLRRYIRRNRAVPRHPQHFPSPATTQSRTLPPCASNNS